MRYLRQYIRQLLLTEAAMGINDLPMNVNVIVVRAEDYGMGDYVDDKVLIFMEKQNSHWFAKDSHIIIAEPHSGTGPCNNAWQVAWSQAENNWGPFLYDIAMEYATMNGGGLTCDRRQVSEHAYDVWEYYLQKRKGEVFPKQLDMKHAPYTDDPSDDCTEHSSANNFERMNKKRPWIRKYQIPMVPEPVYLDYWKTVDPLSKSYTKPPTTIKELSDRFKDYT